MIAIDTYLDMGAEIATAWRRGGRVRIVLATAFILVVLAIAVAGLGALPRVNSEVTDPIAAGLGVAAGALVLSLMAYERSLRRMATIDKIERAERRVEEHPKQAQAAWELAQIKLETYLNRNLSQVRSIYWLTIFVMCIGFAFVGIGIFRMYADPNALPASVLSASSGVLISFIGGSFLLIFRSTVQQAREYMSILERINAVGMAVQILDSLEDETGEVRRQTTADLARDLLKMYTLGGGK